MCHSSKCFINAILLCVFVMSFVFGWMLHCISSNNKAESENKYLKMYIAEQQKNVIKIEEDYYNARKLRHDISKMLHIYIRLLKENRVKEVIEAMGTQIEDVPPKFWVYVKENSFINAVINEKKELCRKSDIELCVQITALSESTKEMDMALMLYNLLDNAIETQVHVEKNAKININIFQSNGMYNMVVKNTIHEPVLTKNPGLDTNKENVFYHGIGLKSIRDTVEKYDGMIDFDECGEQFVVHVAIPI